MSDAPAAPLARPVIGIMPAAGVSARLSHLPCSKELLPVGFVRTPEGPRPKPVCLHLLERMRTAGIERVFIVLRPGKWDIPAYLGHGAQLGMSLAYLIMDLPHGAPYTADQAYPFARDCLVALGFPDIVFDPLNAYTALIARQRATDADVVLGLFCTDQPHTADMVDVGQDGRVRRIDVKPAHSDLSHTWMLCVWAPRFTEFLHAHLLEHEQRRAGAGTVPPSELHLGHVIEAAIGGGLRVEGVHFNAGTALDVGTPDNLVRAVRRYSAEPDEG